ncbi:unnamed protein product [Eruca vesicaria subsp. sativa]|uniref:Uncharacterized protein n=1 Tax=Eruca vesicaria subsp. sativa TaxID=29727 RepID=A0ABC8L5Q3_ERUVS|nr:unnamed protein product [Eruca vesicaria subsp. sativa]
MLKPNDLVPEIDNIPNNTLSTEDNKHHDLEQKLLSGPKNSCAHRSHFGWLRRIFSPSKPTSSPIPNPQKLNSRGEKMFNRRRYSEALEFYDQAIELSPKNVTYLINRAAALSKLLRIGEALSQWEEAIKLDPKSAQARHGLGMSLLSLGHVNEAVKLVEEASYDKYAIMRVKNVEAHFNACINARRRSEWTITRREATAAMCSTENFASPELAMCRVEALVKLSRIGEAHAALVAAVPKLEPIATSFSLPQTRFFDMICEAYIFFVKSQINLALERYKDAAEDAAKALEIEPHNIEIKILKKNIELIQRALSSSKLKKWAEAVRDYEIVHEAMPYDKVIAKYLSQTQVALKQSRSEVVLNMESGGDVKEISSLEELKDALARPDKSVKIIYS